MLMHTQAIPLTLPDRFIAKTRSWREGLRNRQAAFDRFAGEASRQIAPPTPIFTPLGPLVQAGAHTTFVCPKDGVGVLHVAGRWRGLVSFMTSDDGITWQSVALASFVTGVAEVEATQPGMWRTPPGSAGRFLRVQVWALTRGTVTGTFAAAWSETHVIPLPRAA